MNIKSTVAIFFTEGHDADCSNRKRGDFSDSARTPDAVKPEENVKIDGKTKRSSLP